MIESIHLQAEQSTQQDQPIHANTKELLARARERFSTKPFIPHPLFKGGHAQTLAAFAWPRRRRFRALGDEERLFQTSGDVTVLAHCRWQERREEHGTILICHGIEGSSASNYMLSTRAKAFAAGFNVIRMNIRTCGATEHLTPKIYHGGLTEDLREVVNELIERDGLNRIFLVGFSLGGNMVLKLAGEYGAEAPKQIWGVCAVSPSVDLAASSLAIMDGSNWLYHRDFVLRLKSRMKKKHKLFPELYDISRLSSVRTLRDFDDCFTAPAYGFKGADDYYNRASSIHLISQIRVPTLIIHAQDDPFIPFGPLRNPDVAHNPNILLLDPAHGGHVAFLAAKLNHTENSSRANEVSSRGDDDDSRFAINGSRDTDRFWAENRLVEFCRLANQAS